MGVGVGGLLSEFNALSKDGLSVSIGRCSSPGQPGPEQSPCRASCSKRGREVLVGADYFSYSNGPQPQQKQLQE